VRITRQLEDLKLEHGPLVLAVGSFDGVHKGHQAIIGRAVEKARAAAGEAWTLTLDPHPLKVLKPDAAPPLITSTQHKLRLIEELGVDGCVVMPFTLELAGMEPEAFLERLKAGAPTIRELVVGSNWTFGHRGRGNVELLERQAPALGLEATVIEPIAWKGSAVSSTRIRQAVAKGHLHEAEEMMGRPFSILGTVVSGRKIGTLMGFPTANLDPHNEVRPPSGVYAVRVAVGSRLYGGAAFLAKADEAKTSPSGFILEVHLLDFERDLYGEDIEVLFVKWIRDVQHFPSRARLRDQIARDVEQVRGILAEKA
jgi:riboflavin kinase / FMN adenylyltransferase